MVKKKNGIGWAGWLGIFGASILGISLMSYLTRKYMGFSGVYGGSCNGCVKGMAPSKERAHRWLESQMRYQGETPVDHEVIDMSSGMELNKMDEFAKVLHRSYGQAVTHEHVPYGGIGRPE